MEDKFIEPTRDLSKRLVMAHITACGHHPLPPETKELYEYWKGLFAEYNEAARDPAQKRVGFFPLQMVCGSCYMKVYQWHLKKKSPDSLT